MQQSNRVFILLINSRRLNWMHSINTVCGENNMKCIESMHNSRNISFNNTIQFYTIPSTIVIHFETNLIHQARNRREIYVSQFQEQTIMICKRKLWHVELFLDFWFEILSINEGFWFNLAKESLKISLSQIQNILTIFESFLLNMAKEKIKHPNFENRPNGLTPRGEIHW